MIDIEPKPREFYRHFKGNNTYEVVAVARDVDNLDKKLVIYKSLYECAFPIGTIWSRSLEEFVGFKTLEDGTRVKRFTKVE